jgi:hypothetical protein
MLRSWLNKPFPYIDSLREQLLLSLTAGLIVVIFLIVFQPFGINLARFNVQYYLVGFGVITFVVIFLSYIFFPVLFSRWISLDSWTIGKSLLFVFWILFIITICNYFYGQYLGREVYDNYMLYQEQNNLLAWIFMTFSIGIFPIVGIIYYTERKLLHRNTLAANSINNKLSSEYREKSHSKFSLELGKDNYLEIDESDLITVKAEGGNYSTVIWETEGEVRKELVRITLTSFLDITKSNTIVRCHKSYIVNLVKIISVEGNARSLMISLQGIDEQVPVSRSFPREQLILEQ